MNDGAKMPLGRLGYILVILSVIITMAILLYPIKIPYEDIYSYEGVDCYINLDVNSSLSNVRDIINKHGLSSEIWYNRSSPDSSGEIVDYVYFSFNYSSTKNISGYIYNFDTENLTIKLHYYPDEHPDRYKTYKTADEARNATNSRYLAEKNNFEPDVDFIISIFNSEFGAYPRSVDYIQLIRHNILL